MITAKASVRKHYFILNRTDAQANCLYLSDLLFIYDETVIKTTKNV